MLHQKLFKLVTQRTSEILGKFTVLPMLDDAITYGAQSV